MAINLKEFYKSIVKFVDNNPDLITAAGVSAPIIIKLIKSGAFAAIAKEMYAGIKAGLGAKEALQAAMTSQAAKTAALKGVKTAAVLSAAAFAFCTLKEAVKGGKVAIEADEPGWKKILSFAWNTSIPGATVNQFRAFGKWLTTKPSKKGEDSSRSQQLNAGYVQSQESLDKLNRQIKDQYDQAAKKGGFVERPTNPQAENEWQKAVGNYMKKEKKATPYVSGGNKPEWYFQGLADKLIGTNLTWTGVKNHDSKLQFVAACALHVNLLVPQDSQSLLHREIISNTNIMWQALRGKNTGAFNYTEEDVFLYTFLLSGLIAAARFTAKMINISNSWDIEVSSLPKMLYACYANDKATNVNTGEVYYQDVITNKSSYVTQLNAYIKEINTYALCGTTLISRWNYLADKCFKDYNGKKAIYGFYALDHVPAYDNVNNYPVYGGLENLTIPQLLNHLAINLNVLRTYGGGVLLKVAGDMIKLLGAGKETFDNVPYITGTEVLRFDYDPEAFDQIRNARMLPLSAGKTPSYDRTVPGDLSSTFANKGAYTPSNFDPNNLINLIDQEYVVISDREKLDAKENIQMIQFFENVEQDANNKRKFIVRDCGTSNLNHMTIARYGSNNQPETWSFCGYISIWNGTNDSGQTVNGIDTMYGTNGTRYHDWMKLFAQIDFMPRYQLLLTTQNYVEPIERVFDVDNYAWMTLQQYRQLNDVAVYSQTFTFLPSDVKIVGLLA